MIPFLLVLTFLVLLPIGLTRWAANTPPAWPFVVGAVLAIGLFMVLVISDTVARDNACREAGGTRIPSTDACISTEVTIQP